jgi:hypothetical protein
MPEKVADQAVLLQREPDVDVLYGPVIVEQWSETESRREQLPIPEPHDPWTLLARWFLPQTGAPLWRKRALLHIGGWTPDQPCCQEHELYLRLLIARKRFRYAPATGAVYRRFPTGTVSTSDMALVRRERMKIEERLERHLAATGQLTPERQWAINQARFEMARHAWPEDRAEALAIFATISEPHRFRPNGAAATEIYRVVYGMLGFEATERIAAVRRRLARRFQ